MSQLLNPDLNKCPPDPGHIYLMGICGTGMASLAGILKKQGYQVTGSDENVYPPMSLFLEDMSIPVFTGYSPDNFAQKPDLVIVGNVITRANPEAIRLSKLNIPYLSFPQALRIFAIRDKRSIVIAGTHGKTTTTSLISWILKNAELRPGFMIGGISNNFQGSFEVGEGAYFVVEGDEYDTAFFDKGPKFLHYNPWVTILTSIEFDHADIFRDLDHVIETFRKLIEIMPSSGLLIANADYSVILSEIKRSKCKVITYGFNENADWRVVDMSLQGNQTKFQVFNDKEGALTFTTPLYGDYNISNILSAVVLSHHLNIDPTVLGLSIENFKGVKRRQEVRGEKNGVLVIDDFAHHPTAVENTVSAVKTRYYDRRLIAVFEPRSNSSRRKIFQEKYGEVFDNADLVFIPEPPLMNKVPADNRFSSVDLVKSLGERGLRAFYCGDSDQLLNALLDQVKEGDVVLIMSNGSFDNIHKRLLDSL